MYVIHLFGEFSGADLHDLMNIALELDAAALSKVKAKGLQASKDEFENILQKFKENLIVAAMYSVQPQRARHYLKNWALSFWPKILVTSKALVMHTMMWIRSVDRR